MLDRSRRSALRLLAAAVSTVVLASCGGGITGSDAPDVPPLFRTTYVFGASLDDTGNACNLSAANCPPAPPYATGRYSNGPLWVELVAANYGASVLPSRLNGTNYSFAGARTGAITGTTQTVPNMNQQLDTYLAAVNFGSSSRALFVVNAATVGNDIVDALTLSATNPNAPTIILTAAVGNIVGIVNRLYASGARHILVANSTDVGKTPRAQALGPAAAAGATQLSLQFNAGLAQQIANIRAASPDLSLYVLDLGTLTAQVIANPASFGFSNVTAACFNTLVNPPTLCGTPDTFFFWDPFHPSAATGRLVAQRAIAAIGR